MRRNFTLAYLILVAAKILICNYFHVSHYVMLSILVLGVLFGRAAGEGKEKKRKNDGDTKSCLENAVTIFLSIFNLTAG